MTNGEEKQRFDLNISVSFNSSTHKATISVRWSKNVFVSGESKTWNIEASGAIVAEERAFLLALKELPSNSQVTVYMNSTHVKLRFEKIWKHNTDETKSIIDEAIEVAKVKNLIIDFHQTKSDV